MHVFADLLHPHIYFLSGKQIWKPLLFSSLTDVISGGPSQRAVDTPPADEHSEDLNSNTSLHCTNWACCESTAASAF